MNYQKNYQVTKSIHLGLEFLTKAQQPSGRFAGRSNTRPTDTIFFTALILDCLNAVEGTASLRSKSAHYLLLHKSDQWSWNYWERHSKSRPYPDDLDDSACSIAALAGFNVELIDPEAQAHIAKNLIACETKPGGPYVTWLVPHQETVWRDVDPAVNANIGYMLARLGVRSGSLNQYIESCIANNSLASPYYQGIVPTLYFIARWYMGTKEQLSELIAEQLRRPVLSSLERAMLVTAACNLGYRSIVSGEHISRLVKQQRNGAWPARTLYYEPPENGKRRYAGSAALTTAFVIEALSKWQVSITDAGVGEEEYPTTLRQHYQRLLLAQDRAEVIDSAGIIARAGRWNIKDSTLRHLNRGSRNGWLAYTIYDDFLDDEGKPEHLSVANVAMRQSLWHFNKAITDDSFKQFIERVFMQVDIANAWELQHARDPQVLPRYGAYAKLAQRSWGHVIAPTGVLVAAGYALDSPEAEQLHNFFRHYSIAKQFCDDAHDWLSDMRNNHITPVVALVLMSCPDDTESARQLYFWQYTIDEVNVIIRKHLAKAQTVLDSCKFFTKKTELQAWLDGLEAVCLQAEQGRQAAQQFITTFSETNLVNL